MSLARLLLVASGGFSPSRVSEMHAEDLADRFAPKGEAFPAARERGFLDEWELANAARAGFCPVFERLQFWARMTRGDREAEA